jgi:general secretion pathway protein H
MAAITHSHSDSGFTLLEILVVVALMGLLAGVVSLSLSGGQSRQVREEADRLRQVLTMAGDEAVFQGVELGAMFTPRSYGFVRYDNSSHDWKPLEGKSFRAHVMPQGIQLTLKLADKQVAFSNTGKRGVHPAVMFLSSGEMTAFTLAVTTADTSNAVVMGTDGISPVAAMAGGQ